MILYLTDPQGKSGARDRVEDSKLFKGLVDSLGPVFTCYYDHCIMSCSRAQTLDTNLAATADLVRSIPQKHRPQINALVPEPRYQVLTKILLLWQHL